MAVQRTHQNSKKNESLCLELLNENDFGAVLATFCCYNNRTNASEVVQKIAADQKIITKAPLVLSLLKSQNMSINNSEKWLVTYLLGHLQHS